MKVELTPDELCLVVAALNHRADAVREPVLPVIGPSGSYDALALAQHGAKCADLADRLHEELEAAERAENLLDNME